MEYIEFEKEFKAFMEKEGKVTEAIKDYMSRLRFIAKNGFYIGRGMLDIDTIIDSLKKTESNRKTYKNSKQYSNLKSALKKYKYFITAKENNLVDDIEAIRKDRTISETQKELLTFARIGQGKYRKDLIELWGKCSVSECNMTDLLIASHIKPWSESSNEEKLDRYNGLLLLPNYDKLFDKHLISFDDDGKIIISSQIKEEEYKVLGISANDKLFKILPENKPYLKIHREIFCSKNNMTIK
ncbi:HNH endonuclease [Capnocytophaga gingivalis]|uniref:HNH endonuclease n=1 Tax=Capnocytophaga gingivalis TaxID=1017 RepID=A0A250FQU3_9FLAO|nr:HNH endonuclease signature motif containing protein [Capnocytophaga gingivalis]ATA87490.1 HNH endonuclease [Capnocytophaga gingivalis]